MAPDNSQPKDGERQEELPQASDIAEDTQEPPYDVDDLVEDEGPFPASALKGMPTEVRRMVQFGAMQMSGIRDGRASLVNKLEPEHITALITQAGEDSERSFRDVQRRRYFAAGILIIVLLFIGFLVTELGSVNPDLLEKIVAALLGAVGGFGGGYAYRDIRQE